MNRTREERTKEAEFIVRSGIPIVRKGIGMLEIPSIVFVKATQMTKERLKGKLGETFPPD